MGAMLPKPVESSVVERISSRQYRVGVAEMNGWRSSMEDAHLIYMRPDWAFFGVFDGHGGSQCSAFVANKLREQLEAHGCPEDAAAVKRLILDVDAAFLDTGQASGSTATMCIVHPPSVAGGKCQLRVINAGDSRVLLGRSDGTIVDGGGTDQGLTTDHKPSHPAERQRIYRCGGHVEEAAGGVARVNGDLAVSRGFGDAEYKKTGGPGPEDRPVTADPELGNFECDQSDFLLLVCDGVSEGDFPNAEVVKLVAAKLAETDDPGAAARAVCIQAVASNSKDNITCMVVLLKSEEEHEREVEFTPGPLAGVNHKGFLTAYAAMAEKAGLTLAQAAERRYDLILKTLAQTGSEREEAEVLELELAKFGTPACSKGTEEWSAWFQTWVHEKETGGGSSTDGTDPDTMLMQVLMSRLGGSGGQEMLDGLMGGQGGGTFEAAGAGRGGGEVKVERRVRVPDLLALKTAVEEHVALKWADALAQLAGAEGIVQTDDLSDGTSHVLFNQVKAWLPTDILIPVDSPDDPADAGAGPRP